MKEDNLNHWQSKCMEIL